MDAGGDAWRVCALANGLAEAAIATRAPMSRGRVINVVYDSTSTLGVVAENAGRLHYGADRQQSVNKRLRKIIWPSVGDADALRHALGSRFRLP